MILRITKNIFFILATLLIFLPSLPVLAISCTCNGIIEGQPFRGTLKQMGTLKDACVDGTAENKIEKLADCTEYIKDNPKVYLDDAYKSSAVTTFEFKGTCEETIQCKDPNAAADEVAKKLELKVPVREIFIPNLNFTELENTVDDNGNIQVPWIGEYIKAIYNLAVTAASVLGVVMLIREGLRIVLSAGGDEKVQGYKNIGRVMTGLLLAWLSYVILYNLNSDLVAFRALKVKVVDRSIYELSDEIDETKYKSFKVRIPAKSGTIRDASTTEVDVNTPPWRGKRVTSSKPPFDCSKRNQAPYNIEVGVVPKDATKTYRCPDVDGTITTLPEMEKPICDAGAEAKKRGFMLSVQSSYRTFTEQVKGYCDGDKASHAVPGYSNHGHGRAIDVFLYKLDSNGSKGTRLTFWGYSGGQCVNEQYVKEIADIFRSVDTKFNRLESEVWHFEYGTEPVPGVVGDFRELPKQCKK